MKKTALLFGSLLLGSTISLTSCKKDENQTTLNQLYQNYKNGEITECTLNGETVYSGSLNAYDAGTTIYDKDGEVIGSCNYAWNQVDDICNEVTDCEVIYRTSNNIWGQPAVDKYDLD